MGPQSDIWSLGAVLYQALTGRPLFLRDSEFLLAMLELTTEKSARPSSLVDSVGSEIDEFFSRMLVKDPERRPHLAEMANAFSRLAVSAPEVPPPPRPTFKRTLGSH